MTDRYLAIVGDDTDNGTLARQAARATMVCDLVERVTTHGLVVLTDAATEGQQLGGNGFLVGRAFPACGSAPLARSFETERFFDAPLLTAERWGDYVAFLLGFDSMCWTRSSSPRWAAGR